MLWMQMNKNSNLLPRLAIEHACNFTKFKSQFLSTLWCEC